MLDNEPQSETLLDVNNIEVIYNHVILVLKGVSLQVPKGGITALLGGNGAGKTTTLKALLRELRSKGLQKVIVGAYTGVAASNIGLGARTLTDLFRLAKVNNTSGELAPLEGDDLTEFVAEMDGDIMC